MPNNAPKVASSGTINNQVPPVKVSTSVKNISLDKNPLVSGIPPIAAAATIDNVAVHGNSDHKPPSLRRLRVPVW